MNHQMKRPRLSIFIGDFKQARRFASFILQQKFHTKTHTDLRELKHLAFNTSLVISYSRPFSSNRDLGNGKSSLKDLVSTVLDEKEVSLHKRVLELRDTAYGHSDARSHLLPQIDYTKPGFKFMKYAFTPLSHDETRRLNSMIGKWLAYLEGERARLKSLSAGHTQQIAGPERG